MSTDYIVTDKVTRETAEKHLADSDATLAFDDEEVYVLEAKE